MQTPLIYIIVPVYNVERYLKQSLDSLISQTYQNLKVILVDDGSSDASGKICDEYAAADKRIQVIHKPNGGISSARNTGLDFVFDICEVSSEEYIAFVDSDDCVSPDYIEFLYVLLKDQQADIVQCGHYIVFSDKRKVTKDQNETIQHFNRDEAIKSLCYNSTYDITLWNKLYKRDVLRDVRCTLGKVYEDTAISYLISEKASDFVVCMKPKYYYNQRYTSIANGVEFNERKYHFVEVGDEMAAYIVQHYPNLKGATIVKRVYVRLSTLAQMINCNHYDKVKVKEMVSVIKKNAWIVLCDQMVAKRDKLGVFCVLMGFPVYRFVWRMYYKHARKI